MNRDNRNFIILIIILAVIMILSLMCGTEFINFNGIIDYVLNGDESDNAFTIGVLRLPRVLLGLTSGILLGFSGLILQNVLKNPIASPDIMGITGGAALGAVLFITTFSSLGIIFMPVFSVTGALLAMGILIALNVKHMMKITTIVIIGIALQALLISIVNLLIITGKQFNATTSYMWLVGSLYGSKLESVWIQGLTIVIAIPVLWYIIPKMKITQLDDAIGIGLGLKVKQIKMVQLVLTAIFVGIAVSFVGNIGFVGLIAPHIAGTLIRKNYFKKLLASGIVAAICILTADLIGRTLFLPHEISAGVFIAAFGAPFFIYLLLTTNKI